DQSIRFLADHAAERPDAPWLLWLAFGACHAPHQAPFDLIMSYDDVFKDGRGTERGRRIARQKAMGIVPKPTRLPPRNPGVQAWESHSADEQRVFTRLQSAYTAKTMRISNSHAWSTSLNAPACWRIRSSSSHPTMGLARRAARSASSIRSVR